MNFTSVYFVFDKGMLASLGHGINNSETLDIFSNRSALRVGQECELSIKEETVSDDSNSNSCKDKCLCMALTS